jgi:hypothetical protein
MVYGNDEQRGHAEKDAVSCSTICEAGHKAWSKSCNQISLDLHSN